MPLNRGLGPGLGPLRQGACDKCKIVVRIPKERNLFPNLDIHPMNFCNFSHEFIKLQPPFLLLLPGLAR